jgi:hypothetical protein
MTILYMKIKNILEELLNKNKVIVENINNLTQDYRDLLDISNTLIYKSCKKLNITIDSKINHLSVYNCYDSKFFLKILLTGINLKNSKDIKIKIKDRKAITGLIELYNCNNITIKMSKSNYNKTILKISYSTNVKFIDFNNKIINIIE